MTAHRAKVGVQYTTGSADHPMQPIVLVDGCARFKSNAIVEWLFDTGRLDLNDVVVRMQSGQFPREDYEQITQLLGYSTGGWGELSTSSDAKVAKADRAAQQLYELAACRAVVPSCYSGPPPAIVHTPDTCFGAARFDGTRITVEPIADMVKAGDAPEKVAWAFDVPVSWVEAACQAVFHCDHCGWTGTEPEVRMSGTLCPECRTVIAPGPGGGNLRATMYGEGR